MNLFRTVLGVGIQVKIMGMVMGLILFFGMSVTILVRVTLASSLESQLESRGIALARDIAARSTEDILTRNTFALFELARDTIENNQDVQYIFLLDTQGNVVYHSFPGPFPADLLTVNPVFGTQPYSVELLDTEEGLIRDIAAPIFGGRVGVAHIGMSQRRLGATVDEATTRIIWSTGIALIIGLCASFILTYFMTTPIQELAEVSRAVGRGGSDASGNHLVSR
jgi:sensor histidine kinase regulating citrate/malate metabolism